MFMSINCFHDHTFVVERETHVHEYLGGTEVFSFVALEQSYGDGLDKTVQYLLVHVLVIHTLYDKIHNC